MSSWVRYSVAVYIGLLISGALAKQPWRGPSPDREHPVAPSVYRDAPPALHTLPPMPQPNPPSEPDVSA
jgi:hypothetical protein